MWHLHPHPRRDQDRGRHRWGCSMNIPFAELIKAADNEAAASSTSPVRQVRSGRRSFLKAMPLTGLVLVVGLPGAGLAAEPVKYGGDGMPHGIQESPKIYVSIAPD